MQSNECKQNKTQKSLTDKVFKMWLHRVMMPIPGT